MHALTAFIPFAVLLGSCSSPPGPPTVDESQRRPVNSPLGVELQVCKTELRNTRILAAESGRAADSSMATLATLNARQQTIAALQRQRAPAEQANRVAMVRFDFGSAHVALSADIAQALLDDAKAAPLVLVRGRTDGTSDTPAEARIARARADAVRDYLVAAGVDPARIRATHQAVGDHVADNTTPQGRSLNRRVEVELYRSAPVAMASDTAAQP